MFVVAVETKPLFRAGPDFRAVYNFNKMGLEIAYVNTADFYTIQYEAGEVIVQRRLLKDSANSTTYVELKNGDQLVASAGASLYNFNLSNDLFACLSSTGDYSQ